MNVNNNDDDEVVIRTTYPILLVRYHYYAEVRYPYNIFSFYIKQLHYKLIVYLSYNPVKKVSDSVSVTRCVCLFVRLKLKNYISDHIKRNLHK